MAEELVGGCISKKIWNQMCANTLDLENATVEEIEAGLDPDCALSCQSVLYFP